MALNFGQNLFKHLRGLLRESRIQYYSVNPSTWISQNPDTDQCQITKNITQSNAAGITFAAPINLPEGATILSVIVYGSETDETYALRSININNSTTVDLAIENFNTRKIFDQNSRLLVENSRYTYVLSTSSLDINDNIYGAVITYTMERL